MFICVHALQLKNIMNALFSSKDDGTKEFHMEKSLSCLDGNLRII